MYEKDAVRMEVLEFEDDSVSVCFFFHIEDSLYTKSTCFKWEEIACALAIESKGRARERAGKVLQLCMFVQ